MAPHRPSPIPLLLAGLLATPAGHTLELTDQRGVTLELAAPPQRIAYLPPAVRSLLTVDDSDARLVASSAFATRLIRQGLLGKLYPRAGTLPDATSNGWFAPNVEALLATQPELVFQTIQIGAGLYEPIEQAGLKVVGITGVHGEEDFFTWARLAGAVTGKQARAEQLIARFETEGERLEQALGNPSHRPRVLYLMSLEPLRPMVGGTPFDRAIQRAGGHNVAGELRDFAPINFEQVLLWDPEVILISGWPEEPTVPATLFQSPQWSTLAAVREQRVYKVPLGGQRFEGLVEGPLFWQWLAELLHPEKIEPKLREQFRTSYRTLYQYTLSDPEIDNALYLNANLNSAGYHRFQP